VLCIMFADIRAVSLKLIRTRSYVISAKMCRWYAW